MLTTADKLLPSGTVSGGRQKDRIQVSRKTPGCNLWEQQRGTEDAVSNDGDLA